MKSYAFRFFVPSVFVFAISTMLGCSTEDVPSSSDKWKVSSKGGAGGTTGGTGGTMTGGNSGASGSAGTSDAGSTTGSVGGSAANPDAATSDAPVVNDAKDPGGMAQWKYFKTLTFNTTAAGAGIPGDVAKYPIAVMLKASDFDFATAKATGADLRFTTTDGALLPHAIELWDSVGGIAAVWVKVDVKGNSNTQSIIMNWGNAGAPDASDSHAVFDVKEGFLGVWHLGDAPSVTAGGYKDATATAADATGIAMQAGAIGNGRVGRAAMLTASSKQWIRLDGAKNGAFDVFDKVTYSIWTYAKSTPGEYLTPFAKGDNSWRIHMYGMSSWGENKNKHIVEMCIETTGNDDECAIHTDPSLGTDVAPGKWFHWVGVLNHPKMTLYLNGVEEITMSPGSSWKSDPAYPVGMGNNSQIPTRFWDGFLDEARVMNVAKDLNWIKLEYESQREGQKFVTLSATQTRP